MCPPTDSPLPDEGRGTDAVDHCAPGVVPVPGDEGAVLGGQQAYDVALTAVAVFVAGLAVLFVLVAFAPPAIGRYFEPVTRLFVAGAFGFRVWQLAAVALLAVVTWLLVLDIRSD